MRYDPPHGATCSTTPTSTTIGLFIEAHAGLTAAIERELETQSGLSVQWFEVLIRLARTPGHRLRMSDLAAQTTLSASGLTRAVDRLEAAGLVERRGVPQRPAQHLRRAHRRPARRASWPPSPSTWPRWSSVLDSVFTPEELDDLQRPHPARSATRANPCAAKASEAGGLEG